MLQFNDQIDARIQVTESICLRLGMYPRKTGAFCVFITLPGKDWMVKMKQFVEKFSAEGAIQAAEKGLFSKEHCEKHTQGLKPSWIVRAYLSGLKTPTYHSRPTARTSFSAGCAVFRRVLGE
jgi:hypothetical protein